MDGILRNTPEVARLSDTDLEPSKVLDAVANTRRNRKTNKWS